MKRFIKSIILLLIIAVLSGCFNHSDVVNTNDQEPTSLEKESNSDTMYNTINVNINGQLFTATLENNDATRELIKMMEKEPVVLELEDYSGFEKVGPLGKTLTRDDHQTTTAKGDIVLYNGNNIVIFYGSNSWSYTRIGRIDDATKLEEALGKESATVIFSLN